MVLANGQVIEANGTLHPDLHWALRGGGNNFGIVTKITMEILPLRDGRMWGGLRIHQEDQFADVLKAANNLGHLESEDGVKGAQIINFMESQGQKLAVAILTHSDPKPNPPAMSEYLSIQALVDTTSTRSLTNMSKELASSEQQQQGGDAHYFKARGTATFLLNQDIMTFSKDVCFEMFGDLTGVEGVNPACVFQIITKAQMNATLARGGNALGLDPEGGPLFLLNVQVGWTDEADSQRVRQAVQEMIERTVNYGKEKGRDHHFRYMNYAGEFQDVIAGYQKENKGRLIAISERYDPTGVFELL